MDTALGSSSWAVRAGRWWFQWRGVSPVPFVLLFLLLPVSYPLTIPQLLWVAAGVVLAELVRIWAVGYAGSATRTRGDSVPQLVHAGPFRYVRNPLYIANTLMYTLCGVAFGLPWLSLGILVYSGVQYSLIVAFEEDTLKREFGVAYEYYCARVPRWIPSFSPQVESSPHVFNLRKALRSERATLIALTAVALMVLSRQVL